MDGRKAVQMEPLQAGRPSFYLKEGFFCIVLCEKGCLGKNPFHAGEPMRNVLYGIPFINLSADGQYLTEVEVRL